MAIKEFVIGPQNYWEEGYFSGDYTLPNVSKTYLQCDIDNIKGGRVVTGLYYEDNYIDGTYWHDNSIRVEMSVEVDKIKDAQIQATGYFAEGYYSSNYFEQKGIVSLMSVTAGVLLDTDAAMTSESNITSVAGKTVDVQATFNSDFNQTTFGSRTKDIDLYAFTEGALASTVNALRDYQLQASSAFDVATDYVRQRTVDADADAVFTQAVDYQRNRDTASATQVAFSFGINETLYKDYQSNFTSTVTSNIEPSITRDVSSTIESNSFISCVISHIEGADIQAVNFADIVAAADRFRDNQGDIQSLFNQNTDAVKTAENASSQSIFITSNITGNVIRGTISNVNIESNISSTGNATRDYIVSQVSTFDLNCTISHIEGADIQAVNFATIQAIPEVTRTYESLLDSNFVQYSANDRFRDNNSANQITVDLFATPIRIQQAQASITATLTVDTNAVKTVQVNSNQSAETSTSVVNDRLRESVIENFDNIATSIITGGAVRGITENFNSQSNVWAVIGTLESITLIVFNFASLISLPFKTASGNSSSNITSQQNSDAVKIAVTSATAQSEFNSLTAADRSRDTSSALQIEFTSSVSSDRSRDNNVNAVSNFDVSAIIGKQQDINLYAFTNNSLTVDAVVTRSADSNLSCDLMLNSLVGKIHPINVTLNCENSISVDNLRVRFAEAYTESVASQLTLEEVIPGVQVIIGGKFTTNRPYVDDGYVNPDYATNFETVAQKITDITENLSIVSNLSATASYTTNFASLVMSAGELTVQAGVIKQGSIEINTVNSLDSKANFVAGFKSDISSEFNVVAIGETSSDISCYMFNETSLNANADKFRPFNADLTSVSTFYFNSSGALFQQGNSYITSDSDLTADNVRVRFAEIQTEAISINLAITVKTAVSDVDLQSNFNLSVVSDKIKSFNSEMSAQSSQLTEAVKTVNSVVSIQSAMVFTAGVKELRLDEIYYKIPAEDWNFAIAPETRSYSINGETRLRKITQETAQKTITSETRIYIID